MLITFSENHIDYGATPAMVIRAATRAGAPHHVKWWNGAEVRFTLPGATTAQHESVILALLELDPRATIRTSRARYVGLDDYKRQRSALTT